MSNNMKTALLLNLLLTAPGGEHSIQSSNARVTIHKKPRKQPRKKRPITPRNLRRKYKPDPRTKDMNPNQRP